MADITLDYPCIIPRRVDAELESPYHNNTTNSGSGYYQHENSNFTQI